MHPALTILTVVFAVQLVNLIGRERIEAAARPVYVRLLHGKEVKQQKELKRELYLTRQQLNLTSSQDEFAKWAKLRRKVDKAVSQLEASNARLAGATSAVSLLVRAVLFLATTLFPFCLTFYYGKTPMFFLPPSDVGRSQYASATKTGMQIRRAPGGFEIPYDAGHAWGMLNETYLGPLGWLLCMTAAPRGSVSAGMWSTVCTRVALLLTNQIKDAILAIRAVTSKSSKAEAAPTGQADRPTAVREKPANDQVVTPSSTTTPPSAAASARKRAAVKGEAFE